MYCFNYKKLSIHQTFTSNDFILKVTEGTEIIHSSKTLTLLCAQRSYLIQIKPKKNTKLFFLLANICL